MSKPELVYKTRAHKTDFKYALSNHIPLLMIMEERGLELFFFLKMEENS